MLSVTQLAHKHNVSRTTVLFYERKGLLLPQLRTANGYRWYGDRQSERLKEIIAYRSFGIPLSKIPPLLDGRNNQEQEKILKEQFNSLENEINKLRQQQKTIIALLENPGLISTRSFNKEQWVAIMKAAGLDETDMKNWHFQFEQMQPDAHQAFLESLDIDSDEIKKIRAWALSDESNTAR